MHAVRYIDEKTYQSSKTLLLKLSLQSGNLYLKEQDPIRNAMLDTTAGQLTSQLGIRHVVHNVIMRIWRVTSTGAGWWIGPSTRW
jgi:hypothetical protein